MRGLVVVFKGWHRWRIHLLMCLCVLAVGVCTAQAQSGIPCEHVVAPVILDVPFISQMEERPHCEEDEKSWCKGWVNCGPASLAMVLKAYGCQPANLSDREFMSEIRLQMTGVQDGCRNGITGFAQMKKVIKHYCSDLDTEDLDKTVQPMLKKVRAGIPVIVAVYGPKLQPRLVTPTFFNKEPRHIIVITGADDDRVYVNDPGYYKGTCTATQGSWYYTRKSWEMAVAAHGGGALAVQTGLRHPLQVVESLTLRKSVRPGQTLVAHFKLRNTGSEDITLQRLGTSARGPQGSEDKKEEWRLWNANIVDFPFVNDIRLAPGEEYEYRQSRAFDKEGIYFAVLSYWDAQGTWHNLTGPAEFEVSKNAPADDNAALVGRVPVPVAIADAKVTVSIQLRNSGCSDWGRGQGYALSNTNQQALGAPAQIELGADIPCGGVARWLLPLRAPAQAGLYLSEWQMVHDDLAFGPKITIEMRVLSVPDDWLERLREEIKRIVEELIAQLEKELEEALRAELERQLRSICGGAMIVPGIMIFAGMWLADQRRVSPGKGGRHSET